jgi:nitric oxide reductase large subunit
MQMKAMEQDRLPETLSPWWRRAVILTMAIGFGVLLWLAARTYRVAPPIPERVVPAVIAAALTYKLQRTPAFPVR